jgi:hypothetical protein
VATGQVGLRQVRRQSQGTVSGDAGPGHEIPPRLHDPAQGPEDQGHGQAGMGQGELRVPGDGFLVQVRGVAEGGRGQLLGLAPGPKIQVQRHGVGGPGR